MRPHREPGIRRDASGRIQAYVRAGGQLRFTRFPPGTSLETVRHWRLDTRVSLGLTQRPAGTLAADIEPFLRQIADRPRLVADAPNPVRDVTLVHEPGAGSARALLRRGPAHPGGHVGSGQRDGQGKPRAATSAAKVRCRVLAFTGLRPNELMRYLPEHWHRTTQTLVVYTGKGGRTRSRRPQVRILSGAPLRQALCLQEKGLTSTTAGGRSF